jgi:hypothetical protein
MRSDVFPGDDQDDDIILGLSCSCVCQKWISGSSSKNKHLTNILLYLEANMSLNNYAILMHLC